MKSNCRSLPILIVLVHAIAVAPGSAQSDAKPPTDAAKPAADPVIEKLMQTKGEEFRRALVGYIESRIASRLVFAGQHDGLRGIDGAAFVLQEWLDKPPVEADKTAEFRLTCLRALRDIHGKQPPDSLMVVLRRLADKDRDKSVREHVAYALAQFGDVGRVGGMAAEYQKLIESRNPAQQARGFGAMANIYYQMRDFGRAADSFRGMLDLYEARKVRLNGADLQYFNAAGSMALAGRIDDAFAYLKKGLGAGKGVTRAMLEGDPDLAPMRKDPRFAALVAERFGAKAGPGGDKKR